MALEVKSQSQIESSKFEYVINKRKAVKVEQIPEPANPPLKGAYT